MSAETNTVAAWGDTLSGRPARPDRPRRFDDDALNDAYWARVDRIVAAAPPLSDDQRARIRAAFFQPTIKEVAA
ncbi:hypothetical protein [Streptomyces lacrimifluminis]|uniref:hypothetical protein n=1 Tax=Streptomyces lacrimifluminis TaxID=1500077 RepID=UPI0016667B14|nr:hypothetical protein [Streptomyces lacrimifluminis]